MRREPEDRIGLRFTGEERAALQRGDAHPPPEPLPPLRDAMQWWVRRGYRVRYADARFVQLVRRDRTRYETALYVGLATVLGLASVVLCVVGLRRYAWHVVSLTLTPGQRVVTHRLWTRRPPEQ